MLDFSDTTVLITGASGGLGAQMARDFAQGGARLIIHDFGRPDAAGALVAELQSMGCPHLAVEGDLTDPDTVWAIAQRIDAHFGRLDVLVNNAGASPDKMSLRELPPATWDKVIAINLRSVFLITQACLPMLERSPRGRIINISSTAARNGGAPGGSAYAAAKGAISSLTKAWAKEFSPLGIQVNAVAPGLIDTPFYGDVKVSDKYAERLRTIPLKRAGIPADISGPVRFLASPLADYITGEVLEVSGGLSLMA